MTVEDRSVDGRSPTRGRVVSARGLGRGLDPSGRLLFVFSVGTIVSAVLQRLLLDPASTSQHNVEFNIGEMFVLAATGSILADRVGPPIRLATRDAVVLLVAALSWLLPEQHAIYVAMTISGTYLAVFRRDDGRLVDLGQVWIALACNELWGKLIFKCFYRFIETLEVTLIYRMGLVFVPNMVRSGSKLSVQDNWSIVILEGCSSLHNLSLLAVLWMSILAIADRRVARRHVAALGVGAGLIVILNVARILAMLPSRDAYLFWHEGEGATLSALASVAVAVLPLLCCLDGPPWRLAKTV